MENIQVSRPEHLLQLPFALQMGNLRPVGESGGLCLEVEVPSLEPA